MKKIAIGLLIVLIAVFAFFYLRLNGFVNQINEQLSRRQIAVQSIELSFIPTPAITLSKVKYQQFSMASLNARLDLGQFIQGHAILQELSIREAKFSDDAINSIDVDAQFSGLYLNNLLTRNLPFKSNGEIHINLAKPVYGNNRKFVFAFNKGNISSQQNGHYLLQFVDSRLNGQAIGYIESYLDLSEPDKSFTAYMRPDCQTSCLATLKIAKQSRNGQSSLNFFGNNFPIERLSKILSLPNTLTGNADFDIQLQFKQSLLSLGQMDFDVYNGELLGFNLLDLAAQYLPINYNQQLLDGKELNTAYQHLSSSASIDENKFRIQKLQLQAPLFEAKGQGEVNLAQATCDFEIGLSPTSEKYRRLTLPIHFFGSCYSPQYKIQFNKDVRDQIKALLKEKLK